MTSHPFAELFPMMDDGELKELANDIKANGQREDITTLDGMILDGRNRFRACEMAGVEPMTRGYLGDNPLAFVLSSNLHRRHLDASQRAMVATRLANLLKGTNQHENKAKVDSGIPLSTQSGAAEALGVSVDSVKQARTVVQQGSPSLTAAVDAGTVSVNAAAEVAKLPKAEQEKIVAEGPEAVKEAASKKRKAKAKPKADKPKDESETPPTAPPEPAAPDLVKQMETVCRELDQLKATVEAWKEHPESHGIHFPTVVEGIVRIRKDIWGARPAYPCPYCEAKGAKTDCKACKGTQKVVKHIKESGTASMNRYGGAA